MTKAELIKALQDDPSPDDTNVFGYDYDRIYFDIDYIKNIHIYNIKGIMLGNYRMAEKGIFITSKGELSINL